MVEGSCEDSAPVVDYNLQVDFLARLVISFEIDSVLLGESRNDSTNLVITVNMQHEVLRLMDQEGIVADVLIVQGNAVALLNLLLDSGLYLRFVCR